MPTLSALQVDVAEAEHVLAAVERASLRGVGLLRPAHISLAYPWLEPLDALARGAGLANEFGGCPAFPLRLTSLRAFPTRGHRTVLHLAPEDPKPLRDLAAALGADVRGYHPHLSVARVNHDVAAPSARAAVEDLVAPLLPVITTARTVTLRVQYDRRWWRVERTIHLAGEPTT